MNDYNPYNWYWLADDGRVFSSAAQSVIPAGDATYAAWLAAGNHVPSWPRDAAGRQTTQSMQDAMTPYGLCASLASVAQAVQQRIASGGITVNVGTVASPVNIKAETDALSLVLLQGAYTMAQANASATFNWVMADGTAMTLTAAQIITLFNAVTSFVQATFTSLSKVVAAIGAGTITSITGVKSPPANVTTWPANS